MAMRAKEQVWSTGSLTQSGLLNPHGKVVGQRESSNNRIARYPGQDRLFPIGQRR